MFLKCTINNFLITLQLNMEDEDNIDVFQHQTGGGISLSLCC